MKDFSTEIDLYTNDLHVHLPADIQPGKYMLTLVQVDTTGKEEEEAQKTWAMMQDLVKKHNLKAPEGWKFDRDEANREL